MLDTLAAAPEGRSSSSISRSLELSASTTGAILSALTDASYVERLPDRTYRLGAGLLRLFEGLRGSQPMLGAAYDELERLAEALECGCTLSRVNPDSLEVVLSAGSVAELDNPPGHRVPLTPPHGSIATAWRSEEEVEQWLATAPQPLASEDSDRIRQTLGDIRSLGYAAYSVERDVRAIVERMQDLLEGEPSSVSSELVRDQLNRFTAGLGIGVYRADELRARGRRGVSFIIAPVFGSDGQPRYLVTAHLMRDSIGAREFDRATADLLRSAKALTKEIGGSAP